MPTCDNKSKLTSLGSLSAAELDHHASEAAKVKRNKEQAYFNSYDFDAIEVLPYDEDEEECAQHHRHHYSKYSVGGCKACHHTSQPETGLPPTHSLNKPPHHHQQLSKSKKKKESTSSHSSSTSNSSFTHPSNATDAKRTYLKRIGAFLTSHSMGKRSSIEALADIEKQTKCSSSSSQVSLDNGSAVVKLFDGGGGGGGGGTAVITSAAGGSIKRDHVIDEAAKGNFLLPRAMLKYQSVGFGNSMPLAVISNLGGSSTSLMGTCINSQPNQVTNSSSSIKSKSKSIPSESSISATDLAASINNNKQKPPPAAAAAAKNSGFVSSSSSASASSSSLAKSSTLTTSSLSAESSLIIGETSANVDVSGASAAPVGGLDAPVVASKSIMNPNVISSIASDLHPSYDEKLVLSSSSTSANAVGTPSGSSRSKTNVGSGDAATGTGHNSSGRGAHERTSSQSHYSTDKSGSSGYYSSNVCSTYSVEDHIYCEPTIDILEVNKPATIKSSKLGGHQGSQNHRQIMIVNNSDDDDEDHHHRRHHRDRDHQRQQKAMKMNLQILETSIENLDRHLKSYPKLSSHDRIAALARSNPQTTSTHFFQVHSNNGETAKNRNGHLPTIMEGGANDLPVRLQKSWQEEIAEDSLLDIDLDSFLLTTEGKHKSLAVNGIDNPTFDKSVILHDEDMENHYKCAKYINSCPEDAYRLESEVGSSLDHFLKKYDDQIHFQNTRELLEDVRDKIRLLSESSEGPVTAKTATAGNNVKKNLPQELDTMIKALKGELESYLERMNHHSEMEIRQLCTGLVKNQNIVRMKKAFERRKSNASDSEFDFAYEAIRDGTIVTVQHTQQHIETTSIRCSSDPNFKMKRKSLCDVFPTMDAECYVGMSNMTVMAGNGICGGPNVLGQLGSVLNDNNASSSASVVARSQMQRNLSFHKPVLNKLDGGANEDADKNSIIDWHQKKPSNWEMYYGTNRMNQTLLGKRGVATNGNQAIMSYPSSRPESDFTLDLPRAEQLRIKMEKEKKFRRRCRYLTTFLSLVFFLLTVMVVSLVLTRGKRMFGSMI